MQRETSSMKDENEQDFDESLTDSLDANEEENLLAEESDEDWDSFEPSENPSAEAPAKKKSSLFNVIVIAGAVAAGLGVLYWKSSSTGSKISAPPQVAAANVEPSPAPAEQTAAQQVPAGQSSPEEGGFLNDPKMMESLASSDTETQDQPQQDAASGADSAANAELTPLPAPQVQADTADASPQNPATASEQGTAAASFMKAPPAAEYAQAPAEISAKLDELIAKTGALEGRMAAVETRLEAVPEMQSGQSSDLAGIRERLDALESRMSIPAVPLPEPQKADSDSVPETSAPAVEPAPVVRTKPAGGNVEKTAVRWILKSAQPGQAYISRSGQDDMISVRVGDSVAGIGRVRSVDTENGRWVIEGTEGRISQ